MKTDFRIKMNCNYGEFGQGKNYAVLDEGYDWYLVSMNGVGIYVPKILTGMYEGEHEEVEQEEDEFDREREDY